MKWDFCVNSLGSAKINKGDSNLIKGHPGSYMFAWEKVCVLKELQFVPFTESGGVFETKKTDKKRILNEDGFILIYGV
ncbi:MULTISPECIES: hypothetical protein [unclassified Saccharicrinis]|uniref:hypothetical protein n=1 Tax=unclassified Saccharicrinis TaxID=2646859 RepID=UPI003D32E80E